MSDVISNFNFQSKVHSTHTAARPKRKTALWKKGAKNGKKKSALQSRRRRKPGKYLARMVNGAVRDALGFPLPNDQLTFEKVLEVPLRRVTTAPISITPPQDFSAAQVVFAFESEMVTRRRREDRRGLHVRSAKLHAHQIGLLLESKKELPAAKSDTIRDRARTYDQAYSARKRFYSSIFPSTADETLEVTQPLFDGFDGAYREILIAAFEVLPFLSCSDTGKALWKNVHALVAALVALAPKRECSRAKATLKTFPPKVA
jgi:hypothetical protein